MAIQIKYTNEFVPRPRCLIYGHPGDSKTTLAATIQTPGEKDVLLAVTEGGIQSVAHLNLPYENLSDVGKWNELIAFFRSGKSDGQGGIKVGNHFFRSLIVDLHSEFVAMTLTDLIKSSPRYIDAAGRGKGQDALDETSQFDFKKLNMRIIREIREIRNLPLKNIIFTAHCSEYRDLEGNVKNSGPKYVGNEIVPSVKAAMDYVLRISPPPNVKEGVKKRLIRTQPTQVHYAKARVPGVVGALPLPELIDYPLGHPTMLASIFGRVEDFIRGKRLLAPVGDVPEGVQEMELEPDPEPQKPLIPFIPAAA